jgi:hypothetical protein
MIEQKKLFKGEQMEELLRKYFMASGYYVTRGARYRFEGNDITDVDLFLYMRESSMIRNRINVDIKNKKSPQAFERILWANGVMKLLQLDSCIVATTEKRPVVHSFGLLHKTVVLDGYFLAKLKPDEDLRLSEDELMDQLSAFTSYNFFKNKDWRFIYEVSKSKLLSELDFSGYNSAIILSRYFIEKILVDDEKRILALRMLYIVISHSLIIIDFILKDVVFLDQQSKENRLSEGLKFGNLGREGVDRIIKLAASISKTQPSSLLASMDNTSTDVLKNFFAKNENSKNTFSLAREFEALGYEVNLQSPHLLSAGPKSVLGVYLDYFNIERKKFFDAFQ